MRKQPLLDLFCSRIELFFVGLFAETLEELESPISNLTLPSHH